MRTYIDEQGNEIVEMTIEERGPLKPDQIERLRTARMKAQEYDEDCPPMSEEMHRSIQNQIAQKRRLARGESSVSRDELNGAVKGMRLMGASDDTIIQKIMESFNVTKEYVMSLLTTQSVAK